MGHRVNKKFAWYVLWFTGKVSGSESKMAGVLKQCFLPDCVRGIISAVKNSFLRHAVRGLNMSSGMCVHNLRE